MNSIAGKIAQYIASVEIPTPESLGWQVIDLTFGPKQVFGIHIRLNESSLLHSSL